MFSVSLNRVAVSRAVLAQKALANRAFSISARQHQGFDHAYQDDAPAAPPPPPQRQYNNQQNYQNYRQAPAASSASTASNYSSSASAPAPTEKVEIFLQTSDLEVSPEIAVASTAKPFPEDIQAILSERIPLDIVRIRPDGHVYIPEVEYRRILNKAFGRGGWCMVPKGNVTRVGSTYFRDYTLYCHGRFISQATGAFTVGTSKHDYGMLIESVKSNALTRLCKDMGVACDLWDNKFLLKFKESYVESFTDPRTKRIIYRLKRNTAPMDEGGGELYH